MSITLTIEQLRRLLAAAVAEAKLADPGEDTFVGCKAWYGGSRKSRELELFITSVTLFKEIHQISDKTAVDQLPLMLSGEAGVWWQVHKAHITTFDQAMAALHSRFAAKQDYEVYSEIFSVKQHATTATNIFLAEKRALLAELPDLPEPVQMDMLYGLLNDNIQNGIPRESVTEFWELIEKATEIEQAEKKSSETEDKEFEKIEDKTQCFYCSFQGHTEDVCRRKAEETRPLEVTEQLPKVSCFGCGKVGVVKSKCATCKAAKKKLRRKEKLDFWASFAKRGYCRPIVSLTMGELQEEACLDTGANANIASSRLRDHLIQLGYKGTKVTTNITLADGLTEKWDLERITANVTVGERSFDVDFATLLGEPSMTLLGVGFIKQAEIVINMPQRVWHFCDEPEKNFDFIKDVDK